MDDRRAGVHARRGHRRLRRRVRRHRRPATTGSGRERIRDTPISELGIVGAGGGRGAGRACGRSSRSSSPTSPDQAMDQIVNQAAKIHFMLGGAAQVPLVLRAPAGLRHRAPRRSTRRAWRPGSPTSPASRSSCRHRRRRQGPAAGGHRRPQPGHRARAQAALPHQGDGARGHRVGCRSARPTSAARGSRPHDRRDRRHGRQGARGRRRPWPPRASTSPSSTRAPSPRSTRPRSWTRSPRPGGRCWSRRRRAHAGFIAEIAARIAESDAIHTPAGADHSALRTGRADPVRTPSWRTRPCPRSPTSSPPPAPLAKGA